MVYMGSRSAERGNAAIEKLVKESPEAMGKIELVEIDVCSQDSIDKAVSSMKAKGVELFALVNNAGMGLAQEGVKGTKEIINTNYEGPHHVTEAMVPLIDSSEGRIVNVSSGAASMYLKKQNASLKKIFSEPASKEELDACIGAQVAAENVGLGNGYGISKAALSALTVLQARKYPKLKVVALTPGFIDTPMTKGFGAKLTAEQGCVSLLKCLFEDVVSGYYYGSDGLRSPFTVTRDPGMPEYQGEPNPDAATYNK